MHPAMNFAKIIDSMANRYNQRHATEGFAAVFARGGEEISVFASLDSSVRAEGEMIKRVGKHFKMSNANRMQINGMYLQD